MAVDEFAAIRISDLFCRRSLRTRVQRVGSRWVAKPGGGWELYISYAATALAAFKAGEIPHVAEFAGVPPPSPLEPAGLAKCLGRGWFVQCTRKTVEASLVKAEALEKSAAEETQRAVTSAAAIKEYWNELRNNATRQMGRGGKWPVSKAFDRGGADHFSEMTVAVLEYGQAFETLTEDAAEYLQLMGTPLPGAGSPEESEEGTEGQ